MTSVLSRAQTTDTASSYWIDEQGGDNEAEGVDEWTGDAETVAAVPLERVTRLEKQMLALRRDNQQLRNKLEMSVRLIEDSLKRIERLEAVVLVQETRKEE